MNQLSGTHTRDWWHSQTNLEFIWTLLGLNGCLTVGKNMYVPTYVALMAYIAAWNTVGWSPRLKLCPLFKPNLYAPAPVLLLVLDMSMYQTRPPQCPVQVWIHSVIHTCQGTWPWVACGISRYHLVNFISCGMGSCSMFWDFLAWLKIVDLGFHCWLHIHL